MNLVEEFYKIFEEGKRFKMISFLQNLEVSQKKELLIKGLNTRVME